MNTLAPPRYDAPIGRTPDGQPVIGDRAFMDYISRSLFERVGGGQAPTNRDLGEDNRAAVDLAHAALAGAESPRSAVQALEARVAHLEALLLAATRPAPSPAGSDLDTLILGARAWR